MGSILSHISGYIVLTQILFILVMYLVDHTVTGLKPEAPTYKVWSLVSSLSHFPNLQFGRGLLIEFGHTPSITQDLLLSLHIGIHLQSSQGCQWSNLDQFHARQIPSLLYYIALVTYMLVCWFFFFFPIQVLYWYRTCDYLLFSFILEPYQAVLRSPAFYIWQCRVKKKNRNPGYHIQSTP